MSENAEELITPTMVREIFEDNIINEGPKGWCMMICGKVLTVNGKMFYKSRQQAVKAFYNSYHWRAMRHIHTARTGEPWGWWNDYRRTNDWKAFKKVLTEKFGFKIVRI